MFRATSCSSSGESIVSIQHLVYVTLCRWPSSVHFLPDLHTRRSPTQSDIYRMLYLYNWFSWWWARCCLIHVEKWNKFIRIVRQVGYLQYLYSTKMHGQQNIKLLPFLLQLGIWSINYEGMTWNVDACPLCGLRLSFHCYSFFEGLLGSSWLDHALC
jgi:hypothetical protein